MELLTVITKFNTKAECVKYLEKVKWNNIPECPYCGYQKSSPKQSRYTCLKCNRSYSVTVGTIFHSSKVPLPIWFLAISLILSAKKGISSRQLARHLSVDKDTAWFIQKRIRKAMLDKDTVLEGVVETDECFVGGKKKNRYFNKRQKDPTRRMTGYSEKIPVLGMFQRSGKIITKVLNHAWGKEIIPIMKNWISAKSTIVTDGFGGYYYCSEHFESHQVINHSKYNHRYDQYHMNNIEGFWSMFKRSLIGQYHKVSNIYLQDYLNEMAYKFNHRKSTDLGFKTLMNNMVL
jgi:transposase-like protein